MTRLRLIVFLSLLPGLAAVAQTTSGLTGGLTVSTLYGPDMRGAQWKGGFHAGFFVRHQFNDVAALHTELLAATRGFVDPNGTRFQFIYAELPLLASLKLKPHTDLLFGPTPALFIGGRRTAKDQMPDPLTSALRRADVGIALGLLFRPHDRYHVAVRAGSGVLPVDNRWSAQHLTLHASVGIYLPH